MPSLATFSSLVLALGSTGLAQYVLQDDYFDGNFFDKFTFYRGPDPTNGFVDYQSRSDSQAAGLIEQSANNAIMRADSTSVTPGGRPAVRITSNTFYNQGLIVVDVEHMPFGCGTWPAFWTFGPLWPDRGEIDIIEGVNEQEANYAVLHTTDVCTISPSELFTGEIVTDDCNVYAPDQPANAGCAINFPNGNSYGDDFNNNGGGVYATEWTEEFIAVYFFPRGSIPENVLSDSPDPSTWGRPQARFQGNCDIPAKIQQQKLVFTNTFCGDWAGSAWPSSSCASRANTCTDFVQNNPEAFENAFWSVNALRVYTDAVNGNQPNTPPVTVQPLPEWVADPVTSTAIPTTTPAEPVTTTTSSAEAPVETTSTSEVEPTPVEPITSAEPITTATSSTEVPVEPTTTSTVVVEPTPVEPTPVEPTTTTSSAVVESSSAELTTTTSAIPDPGPTEFESSSTELPVESTTTSTTVSEPAPEEPTTVSSSAVVEPTPAEPTSITTSSVVEPAPLPTPTSSAITDLGPTTTAPLPEETTLTSLVSSVAITTTLNPPTFTTSTLMPTTTGKGKDKGKGRGDGKPRGGRGRGGKRWHYEA